MGINNDIRDDAGLGKWHINHRPFLGNDSLLSVTRGELVSDDRGTLYPILDVYLLERLTSRVRT